MIVNSKTTVRKVVSLPRDMWERIADYRFATRIGSEAEAFRQLLEAGLNAKAKPARKKS